MLAILLSLIAGIIALLGVEKRKLLSSNKRTKRIAVSMIVLISCSTIGAIILQKLEIKENDEEKKKLLNKIDTLTLLNTQLNQNLYTSTETILNKLKSDLKIFDSTINKSTDKINALQDSAFKYTNGVGNIPIIKMEVLRYKRDSVLMTFSVFNSNKKLPIRNLYFSIDDWPLKASKSNNPGFMVPEREGYIDILRLPGELSNKYEIYPNLFKNYLRISIGDLPPNSETLAYTSSFDLIKLRNVNYKIRIDYLGGYIDIISPITIDKKGNPIIGQTITKLNSKNISSKKVFQYSINAKSAYLYQNIGDPVKR